MQAKYYLSDDALSYFGFRQQPFQFQNNTSGIFCDGQLKLIIDDLLTKIETEEKIFIISGAKGSGKSSIGKLLTSYEEQRPKMVVRLMPGSPVKTTIDFLTLLVKPGTFNTNDSLKEITNKAAKEIYQMLKDGVLPVIVIDDGHTLQTKMLIEVVKFIHNFYDVFPRAPRIVLLGNAEEIKKKLEGQKSRLVAHDQYHIFPAPLLSRSQYDIYLKFKFDTAGAQQPHALVKLITANRLNECRGNYQKLNEITSSEMETTLEERRIKKLLEKKRSRTIAMITTIAITTLVIVFLIIAA